MVRTDGRAYGHVITKFSRMGRLPHFLSYGAPSTCALRARVELRYNYFVEKVSVRLVVVPTLSSCSLYSKRCLFGSGPSLPFMKIFSHRIVISGWYSTTVLSPPNITTEIVLSPPVDGNLASSGAEETSCFGNRMSSLAKHSR